MASRPVTLNLGLNFLGRPRSSRADFMFTLKTPKFEVTVNVAAIIRALALILVLL